LLSLGTLFAPRPAVTQQAPPPLETIHVAGNVYMLQTPTAGGNIGVFVGPDGVLLVDDQFSAIPDSIVAAVAAISDTEIRFLINTHIHPDHIGGNENLAELGVLIFAHDHVRLRMLTGLRIPRRGGIAFPQPPEGATDPALRRDAIGARVIRLKRARLRIVRKQCPDVALHTRRQVYDLAERLAHRMVRDLRLPGLCLRREKIGRAPLVTIAGAGR